MFPAAILPRQSGSARNADGPVSSRPGTQSNDRPTDANIHPRLSKKQCTGFDDDLISSGQRDRERERERDDTTPFMEEESNETRESSLRG